MQRFGKGLLTATLVAALAAFATAQNFNQWNPRQFYVSPAGSDTNSGTSVGNAFLTITHALSVTTLTPGVATAINVLPGNYAMNFANPLLGETFPLTMPVKGVKLEAYAPGVVIDAFGSAPGTPVIDVVTPSPLGTLPASIVRGLDITGGSVGVSVSATPVTLPSGADPVLRPEIRDCRIHHNLGPLLGGGFGIKVSNNSNLRTEVVIENNEIDHHGTLNVPSAGIRIATSTADAADSTLIRGNNIHDQEVGVDMNRNAGYCRPRLFSNFIWHHEQHVFINKAGPILVNDTLAFAIPFSSLPVLRGVNHAAAGNAASDEVIPASLQMNGQKDLCVIRNCILWNPAVGGFPCPEISGPGPFCIGFDDVEDMGNASNVFNRGNVVVIPNPGPSFVGAPADLHLTNTAGQIEKAELTFLVPGVFIDLDGRGPVRLDIGTDIDGDSRNIDFIKTNAAFAPDRGGDEVRAAGDVHLDAVGVDRFGNIAMTPVANFTLNLTKRANEFAAILVWMSDPAGPVDMNYANTLLSPWGNQLLPSAGMVTLITTNQTTQPLSTLSIPLGVANPVFAECELYYQGMTVDLATMKGDISNRVRVEFNN